MGLLETVQNAADTAIKGAGNIGRVATYVSVSNPTPFDPGVVAVAPTETNFALSNVIKVDFTEKEIDNEVIFREDFKLIVSNVALGADPSKSDYFILSGARFRVVGWITDPADAAFIFHVRSA